MMFATITAEGWVLIIGAIGAVLVQLVLQVFQFLAADRAAKQSEKNSAKIDTVQTRLKAQDEQAVKVKEELIENNQKTTEKLDVVHKLVNGRFTAKIRESAVRARRIADLTKAQVDEIEAANAEAELARHIENERLVAESATPKTP